jgi:hypothetical protein
MASARQPAHLAFTLLLLVLLTAVSWGGIPAELSSPGIWPDKTYRWHYNPHNAPIWMTESQARQLVMEASKVWETCGVRMEYEGDTERIPGVMDGVNVVGWSLGMPAQLRGLTEGRGRNGQLLERDIMFRPDRVEFRLHPRLLRKVISHEFGHAIGLTHSSQCNEVMTLAADCPKMDPESLPITLTEHDLERCRALYGSGQ